MSGAERRQFAYIVADGVGAHQVVGLTLGCSRESLRIRLNQTLGHKQGQATICTSFAVVTHLEDCAVKSLTDEKPFSESYLLREATSTGMERSGCMWPSCL